MSEAAPTALVTGASRGIGRAIAVALARRGFDVAITARTVNEGDATAVSPESGAVLPGSLASTAVEIEQLGRRAIQVPLDLLDRQAITPAVDAAIAGLGHIGVLVNNAIYVGPGGGSLLLDTDPDDLVKRVWGNLTAQLLVTQAVARHMVAKGSGLVIDITSPAGLLTPRRPVGEGGWAMGYAASKAGFHRIADMLALEYGTAGIRAFNIDPGFVATERVKAASSLSFVEKLGVAPDIVGEATAWFIAGGHAEYLNGSYHHAQDFARDLGLMPLTPERGA
jgi:NAD(P)-dependent dehydrogenase (short-subunit alcohol dehydrogenase family)